MTPSAKILTEISAGVRFAFVGVGVGIGVGVGVGMGVGVGVGVGIGPPAGGGVGVGVDESSSATTNIFAEPCTRSDDVALGRKKTEIGKVLEAMLWRNGVKESAVAEPTVYAAPQGMSIWPLLRLRPLLH